MWTESIVPLVQKISSQADGTRVRGSYYQKEKNSVEMCEKFG
jgi:hypothetical protein